MWYDRLTPCELGKECAIEAAVDHGYGFVPGHPQYGDVAFFEMTLNRTATSEERREFARGWEEEAEHQRDEGIRR